MTSAIRTKPRRRWLRFSLRTLLAALTILCIWLGWQVTAARRQHEAIVAILAANGEVEFDDKKVLTGHTQYARVNPDDREVGPLWLREIFGDDFFRTVVEVRLVADMAQLEKLPSIRKLSLGGQKVTSGGEPRAIRDSDLAFLKNLGSLEELNLDYEEVEGSALANLPKPQRLKQLSLRNDPINDAGMESIGAMRNLEYLDLTGSRITDAGFENLRKLSKLKTLRIVATKISDAGFKYVASNDIEMLEAYQTQLGDDALARIGEMRHLKHLSVDQSRITDAGLRRLRSLAHLVGLRMTDTNVSDEGFKYIDLSRMESLDLSHTHVGDASLEWIGRTADVEALRWLGLGGVNITDAGLKHLGGFSNLTELYLSNTNVSDAGLEHLKSMTKLRTLGLNGTRVTPDGIRDIKKALPNTTIWEP